MIKKFLNLLNINKLHKVESFYDFSASEKAKIIKNAARESNRLQRKMVDNYFNQIAA